MLTIKISGDLVRCDILDSGPGLWLEKEEELNRRWGPVVPQLSRAAYPLDCQTAATVNTAFHHCVAPHHAFRREFLLKWLEKHDGRPARTGAEEEEFAARLSAMGQEAERLVQEGRVGAGTVLLEERVPLSQGTMKHAPLLDGQWIDRYWLALAEWGALLRQRGFDVLPSLDRHPLAWDRIYPPATDWSTAPREASAEQVREVREEAQAHLDRLRGGSKLIDGRPYVHIEAYLGWEHRLIKGFVRWQGVLMNSWNEWVDAKGADGMVELAGVWVGKYQPQLCAECQFKVHSKSADLERALGLRRESFARVHGERLRTPRKRRGRPRDPTKPERDELIRREYENQRPISYAELAERLGAEYPDYRFSVDIVRKAIRGSRTAGR